MDHERLLGAASTLGTMLLENGAEIYRVEESMQRIFDAYGIKGGVFAIPTCIIASITDENGHFVSKTQRIHSRATNFDRVSEINDVCRRICTETPPIEEIECHLERIKVRPAYGLVFHILAFAVISFSFTLLFGGDFFDALCAAPIGAAVKVVTGKMESLRTNQFFTYIIGSAIGAALAMLAVYLHLATNSDKMIIGIFMNLVPGVAMTNAIRDIIAGDLVAGSAKITEALMIGIALALGAGIALSGTRFIWGV